MQLHSLCSLDQLEEKQPTGFQVKGLDLAAIRYGDEVSVLYGRCLHRGALMADGHVDGDNLICGVHGWDYRYDTGVSEYNNAEALHKFSTTIKEGKVWVNEAKIALATGAQLAGTGICSGEGGMLPDEQANNERYFYELASGKFGFSWDKLEKVQAFHFKGGQGAKTGTGGHLPGNKVTAEIASVRGLKQGETAISPAAFPDLKTVNDFKEVAAKVREVSGGVPVGFKIAASHVEADIDFALAVGVDYIILDGRGGGTGSAPTVLRNNINVPTIPALARARKHLDKVGAKGVSLVITGGLRVAEDFAKAMMLGADAVAISNSALQAIGCLGMRACNSNNCPVGIATQKNHLRQRLIIDASAQQLYNFFHASNELLKVIARSCGHDHVNQFNFNDLSTYNREMHYLTGIPYAGVIGA